MPVLLSAINAVRTHCVTGETSTVRVGVSIQPQLEDSPDLFHVYLVGGPTGYEAFCIPRNPERRIAQRTSMMIHGWCACGGTKNTWDKMVVPAESCTEIFRMITQLG
jgi:hypothetical protein